MGLLFFQFYISPIYEKDLPWYLKQIEIEKAWGISNGGNSNITIAIIDSGIDFNHPSLAHSQWINKNEIPNNDVDDDNNGFIDDIHGWDFFSSDNTPGPEINDPIDSHGTSIAGIIAGKSTSKKIMGISPNVKLMDLRILNKSGSFVSNYTVFADAVYYAINNSADIINLSLQYFSNSSILSECFKEAVNSNIPVVSITGNYFKDSEPYGLEYDSFPGAFPEVIAVSATNFYFEKADYANFGSTVELVAPVGDANDTNMHQLLSTSLNDGYSYSIGTSFASPQVCAVIALMKSIKNDLSVEEIRLILRQTAIDLGTSGWDNYFGYGLLNSSAAVFATSLI